ncbi:uncharacterized protein G2W53_038593 [Senna tora]|uniref:Uncharacterized protein n=1 Tax=Senna tora TaxID=362788 RepID=A0A834SS00_9FABA|nr:uncharacterized protein G2W53_038593 [Senna tora]
MEFNISKMHFKNKKMCQRGIGGLNLDSMKRE